MSTKNKDIIPHEHSTWLYPSKWTKIFQGYLLCSVYSNFSNCLKLSSTTAFFFFSDAGSSQVSDTVFGFISLVSRIVPSPAFSFVYVFTEEKLGDLGSIPALGRSPGEGNSYPLRILALRITWAEEPGRLLSIVAKNRTRLSDFHFHSWFKYHVSFRCTIQRLSFTYIYTHTHTHTYCIILFRFFPFFPL